MQFSIMKIYTKFLQVPKIFKFLRGYASKIQYEMPEKYRDSFYLANASFFDSTNWFIHRSYEIVFSNLVDDLKKLEPVYNDYQASKKIRNIISSLEPCNAVVDLNFPIKRKNGFMEMIRGFRVQHGIHYMNLPCLGGLRIGPEIERVHLKALAALSTYKHSCMDINIAGSHGGIRVDPREYEEDEMIDIVQNFARELSKRNFLGQNFDVIEPDMNCGQMEMAWISEINKTLGNYVVAKPESYGGLLDHIKALSQGIYFGLDCILHSDYVMEKIELEKGWTGKTFIVQGLGKVGLEVAAALEQAGTKCVGVKEWNCSLYDPNGINIKELLEHITKHKSLLNFSTKIKPYEGDQVLKEQCDLIILAAAHKTLTCYTADEVKAKIIVEAANGPVTPTAHKILIGRKKVVIPDVFINSGSSIASKFEYKLQTKDELKMKAVASGKSIVSNEEDIRQKFYRILEGTMRQSAADVLQIAERHQLGLDIRSAAYIKSIKNIFKIILNSKNY